MFAVAVLTVRTLGGTAADGGRVDSARCLPYPVLGLVVGALADRVRRKPLLVGTDLARAALLCAVPLLAWPDLLSVPELIVIMAVLGLASLVNDAAHQSFLPRLLPRDALPRANARGALPRAKARLEQSSAAAETVGGADRPHPTGLQQPREAVPGLHVAVLRGVRPVDEQQVELVQPEPVGAALETPGPPTPCRASVCRTWW